MSIISGIDFQSKPEVFVRAGSEPTCVSRVSNLAVYYATLTDGLETTL